MVHRVAVMRLDSVVPDIVEFEVNELGRCTL